MAGRHTPPTKGAAYAPASPPRTGTPNDVEVGITDAGPLCPGRGMEPPILASGTRRARCTVPALDKYGTLRTQMLKGLAAGVLSRVANSSSACCVDESSG
jgi:hypothetical protein